jgi:hypothetical protein
MKKIYLAAILAAALWLCASPALGDSTYYDATNSIIDVANPVGSTWHELYPNYCTAPYEITGWKDSGDGYLSYCDTIDMTYDPDGADPQTSTEHVIEVTYTLEVLWAAEPGEPHFWDWQYVEERDPLSEPVCTWWTEIYPGFGDEWHIAAWEDNGSGVLDFCDFIVDDDGGQWHVEGVHTDIVTEPVPGTATEPSTWGKVKSLFKFWE